MPYEFDSDKYFSIDDGVGSTEGNQVETFSFPGITEITEYGHDFNVIDESIDLEKDSEEPLFRVAFSDLSEEQSKAIEEGIERILLETQSSEGKTWLEAAADYKSLENAVNALYDGILTKDQKRIIAIESEEEFIP